MSISTRSSLRTSTTTLNKNNFNRTTTNNQANKRTKHPVQTVSKAPVNKAKSKFKHTRKKLKNSLTHPVKKSVSIASKKPANMLSTALDKSSNQQQFSQVKNKFPNYRRKSSAAIKIPSSGPSQHHHQPNAHNSFQMGQPVNPFNRQASFGSVPSQPMSMPTNPSPMNFSSFQFNPTAIAAAAVTLVQMIQNASQNKDNQQTQQQQQSLQPQSHSQQRIQQQHSSLSNRRNVNVRYASSSSSFATNSQMNDINNVNLSSSYKNTGFNNQFINKNYSTNSSSFMQQAGGPFSSNQHQQQQHQMQSNSKNQQQSQSMPYNHRYSTRFKHARMSIPPAKDKKTAPYNTTQYIMHDYFKRRAIDQECPNEQQQFSDEWNMALATNASSSSVTNLDMLKENATRSTLEDEHTRPEMNLSITESENVGDAMMSVDDDVLLKSAGDDMSDGIKLSSSI